jgi:hypothetical protein
MGITFRKNNRCAAFLASLSNAELTARNGETSAIATNSFQPGFHWQRHRQITDSINDTLLFC